MRLHCVSSLSAIFCNICSIFLSSFCPKLSLSYASDSIFPFISYPPVLNFLFPFCPLSSLIMLFNKSACSSRLCWNLRCFFIPLLSISDNFVFILPNFTPVFPLLAMFPFVFSPTHYDWAHCQRVSVSVHSSRSLIFFGFRSKGLPLLSR